jgi:hypothetical protein
MSKHIIEIEKDDLKLSFEVKDYAQHDEERCKFEVFKDNRFIASFEPDNHGLLNICKSSGTVDEEVLHLIADKIESFHWW